MTSPDDRRGGIIPATSHELDQRRAGIQALEQHGACGVLEDSDDAAAVECCERVPGVPFVVRPLHDLEHDPLATAAPVGDDGRRRLERLVELDAPLLREAVDFQGVRALDPVDQRSRGQSP